MRTEEELQLEELYTSLGIDKEYYNQINEASSDVRMELLDLVENIEMLSWMMSPKEVRGYAKDRPRDTKGRIIVDIVKPHILEDMDYFRPSALHFKQFGKFTNLHPNPHPNSEYKKFWDEETRRCKEGYVRYSDGEWIPGYYYWYLNYSPIMLTKANEEGSTRAGRVQDFPDVWDSDYMFFHYVEQGEEGSEYGAVLKTRLRGYSYKVASMLDRNFYLYKKEKNFAFASENEYLIKDGILNKSWSYMEFIDDNTAWTKLRQKKDTMEWKRASYIDASGVERGYMSEIMGVTTKGNPEKGRGKRGKLIIHEEGGIYPGLLQTWNIARPSIEDGDFTFGYQVCFGTGGTLGSKFEGLEELFYRGGGYKVKMLRNVWDKVKGNGTCGYFVPEYMNRKGCYDKNGNSDVVKALIEVLKGRDKIRKNASKENALTQEKAERPITPQEAVMKIEGTLFPVDELKGYLESIIPEQNRFVSKHYIGKLGINPSSGLVEYNPNADAKVIREFPLKDNLNKQGAIEIFKMPVTDGNGNIPRFRYIFGVDPIDDDSSTTNSLASIIGMDILTDEIVVEYTGRPKTANEFYETCLRILKFYNGIANYEAHPYSQKVFLPNGETKLWGDIQIGDELFAPNGKTTKVVDIPVEGEMPIYKMVLNDGREIMCSDDHIWSVYRLNKHNKELKDYSTKELIEIGTQNKYKQNNFFIPNGEAVEYIEKELPIDAYTMGLIIAEGSIRGSHCSKNQVQISSSKNDMQFYNTVVPYEIKKIGTKGYSWSLVINECKSIFQELGLLNSRSETKFIPDVYLKNSKKVRLELLKGLMDGDGSANKNGSPLYTTSSKQLAEDVASLVRSLGFNANIKKRTTKGLDAYKVNIFTNESIFKLPRKVEKQYILNGDLKGSRANSYIDKIAIKSIEFSHYEKAKCVTVDDINGRYMIGDYVVTHNCDKKGMFAYFSHRNMLSYLAPNPQILKDMEMVKATNLYGNKAVGTNSGVKINAWGRRLQADWMLEPAEGEKEKSKGLLKLHTIRSIGYLKEAIAWNPDGNFDRVSAMGMLMILRQEYLKYKLQVSEEAMGKKIERLSQDSFFELNYRKNGDRPPSFIEKLQNDKLQLAE